VALLMLGLVVGNLLNGLPLDAEGNYRGGVLELPSPLGITVALLNVAMMATHGALYLGLRAEGELAAWARGRASTAWGAYVGLTVAALIAATTARTGLAANFNAHPSLWALPALTFLAVVVIGILNTLGQRRAAFAASVLGVVGMLASAVAAIFPRLVPAAIPAYSLTIAGAASSEPALQAMLIVAPIGVPLVLAYTILLYWTFSGRVTAPEAEEGHSGRPE
jgi:cytochrome d ubiquinol oxidase subunit II